MRRHAGALALLLAASAAACYRDLAQLECDGPDPPVHCMAGSSGAIDTTGTSTESEPGPDAAASTAEASSTSGEAYDDSTGTPGDTITSGTSPETTTGMEAVCGDAVLQTENGEECDDGLLADEGCNIFCKRDRTVFLASGPGFWAGMLQGLEGADNYCVSRAGMAKLPRALHYKAYLSDSRTDAVDRLFAGEGRYVLLDGTLVADDWQALVSHPLQHPIDLTELGEVKHVSVWTGTRYGDGRAVSGSSHCDDWTSEDPDELGSYGWSDSVDANWTESEVFNPDSCGAMKAIYCVEQ